jgi:hypothetical protein
MGGAANASNQSPHACLLENSGAVAIAFTNPQLVQGVSAMYCSVIALCRAVHQALAGNVPRAIWQWSGPISRKLFDSVPFILRESPVAEGCPHCTFVLRYKVLDGLLYTDRTRR